MGEASRKELEALEKALARILQEENPLPPHEQQAREAELSRRLSPRDSQGSPSPAQSLDSQDLSIVSRLLSQVHHLMEGTDSTPTKDVKGPDVHEQNAGADKNMVQTVVEIASAAAEAAKAAAASSGKNLEVMETLLSNSDKNVRPANGDTAEASEDGSFKQPTIDKEMIRRLEKQNRFTHWVLGFMIVASAVWRFKLVSTFIGVRKSFSNPFQAFGDMVVEGLKGSNKEEANGGGKGFHKVKTGFPTFLGGEEKEISKTTEKTEQSVKEDFKIGEAITFSFDNLMAASGFSEKQEVREGHEDRREGHEEGPSKE